MYVLIIGINCYLGYEMEDFTVYSIEYLYKTLVDLNSSRKDPNSKEVPLSVAKEEFKKDLFQYVHGIECSVSSQNKYMNHFLFRLQIVFVVFMINNEFLSNFRQYHLSIDGSSLHCSKAVIKQWCFTICTYCDSLIGELIRGVHMPKSKEDDPRNLTLNQSFQSKCSLNTSFRSVQSMTGVMITFILLGLLEILIQFEVLLFIIANGCFRLPRITV